MKLKKFKADFFAAIMNRNEMNHSRWIVGWVLLKINNNDEFERGLALSLVLSKCNISFVEK